MRCEEVVERLDAFRTGELDARKRRAITAHMQTCQPCVDELTVVQELAENCAGLRLRAPAQLMENVLRVAAGERYGVVKTALGKVGVRFNERGITGLDLGAVEGASSREARPRLGGRRGSHFQAAEAEEATVPARYVAAIERAAAGHDPGAVPVDLAALPAFERGVLERLASIPRGEVRPYAWLAKEVGRPGAARAVGNALAKNPVPLILPCHRVVPAGGGVGGYRFGPSVKRTLLEREGVPLEELDRLAARGVRYIGYRSSGTYCLPTCGGLDPWDAADQVPLRSDSQAAAAGYRPCSQCRPALSAA